MHNQRLNTFILKLNSTSLNDSLFNIVILFYDLHVVLTIFVDMIFLVIDFV